VQLLSDFPQFYDGIFDETGPVFHRMAFTRGGLGKRAQFELFGSHGLPTPPFGTVSELAQNLLASSHSLQPPHDILRAVFCVVYLDEWAHRGEGKVLLPLSEACASHPDAFASLFVPQRAAPVAFRLIRLGRLAYWLRQTGGHVGWRSNVGETEEVLGQPQVSGLHAIPRVLWALDFIPSTAGLLAVDFNTAPDLSTLGETGALTPEQVRRELIDASLTVPAHLAQF
jgi:hypothetical protein